MKTSLMLKEERASMISDLEALVDTAKTEEREFTQDEEARQADLNESIFALDEKIANAEKTKREALKMAESYKFQIKKRI